MAIFCNWTIKHQHCNNTAETRSTVSLTKQAAQHNVRLLVFKLRLRSALGENFSSKVVYEVFDDKQDEERKFGGNLPFCQITMSSIIYICTHSTNTLLHTLACNMLWSQKSKNWKHSPSFDLKEELNGIVDRHKLKRKIHGDSFISPFKMFP